MNISSVPLQSLDPEVELSIAATTRNIIYQLIDVSHHIPVDRRFKFRITISVTQPSRHHAGTSGKGKCVPLLAKHHWYGTMTSR
jgi:hypothetical protein